MAQRPSQDKFVKNLATGVGRSILPTDGCALSGQNPTGKGELAGQVRLLVRGELQDPAAELHQAGRHEAHRGGKIGEVQVPGQFGAFAVVQEDLR